MGVTPSSQNCDNVPWTFKVYVSASGRSDVQNDINRLNAVVKEHLWTRLKYLTQTRKPDWKRPQAAKLQGVEEIYEIRFFADRKQYRPLGFFGPGANEFTVLVLAIEKGTRYDPPSAIDTAGRRRKDLLKGEGSTIRLQINGEDFEPDEES